MNATDIEKFKISLQKELAVLEKELAQTARKNPEHAGDWQGRPDDIDIAPGDDVEIADKLESYEENEALTSEFEIKYNQVKDALARIENGTYGICKIGGEPIEIERLEANPAADTCIAHMNA